MALGDSVRPCEIPRRGLLVEVNPRTAVHGDALRLLATSKVQSESESVVNLKSPLGYAKPAGGPALLSHATLYTTKRIAHS